MNSASSDQPDSRLDPTFVDALIAYEEALAAGRPAMLPGAPEPLPVTERERLARAQVVLQLLEQNAAPKGEPPTVKQESTQIRRDVIRAGGRPRSASVKEPAPASPPPQVEGFEILRLLGRGGMGVVYLAQDLRLNRPIALKFLQSPESTPEDMHRFRTEAEAAAQLCHPNIVQVYGVGEHRSEDGQERPYLVLEYIEGTSLDDWLHGQPQPPLLAAELVEVLARAVTFAHARGIIHRDLKPANVLLQRLERDGHVSSEAVTRKLGTPGRSTALLFTWAPKITDFGLAKRLQVPSSLSQTGCSLGTPSYMAPEQARGLSSEMGPATDVYGLGAVLYELLTGRPPFIGVVPMDTLLRVMYEEPIPPTRLQPQVPRDLETICLKCLHKDPRRRYASAEDLADELRRFKAGEPIRARPAGIMERCWRWSRRHPAIAALTGLLVCLLITSLSIFTWLFLNADQQRRRAEGAVQALRQEESATRTAWEAERKRRDQARRALDSLSARIIDGWLANRQNLLPDQRAFLENILKQYQEYADDVATDEGSRTSAAHAWLRCGLILRRLERPVHAQAAFREAYNRYTELAKQYPRQTAYRSDLANAALNLAMQLHAAGQLAEAEPVFDQVLTTLAGLGTQASAADRLTQARAHYQLGRLRQDQKRLADAEAHWNQAREQATRLAQDQPQLLEAGELASDTIQQLSHLLTAQQRFAEAQRIQAQYLAQWQRLVEDHPTETHLKRRLGVEYSNIGASLQHQGRLTEAEAPLRKSVEILSSLVAKEPDNAEAQPDLALSYLNLGIVLNALRRLPESKEPLVVAVSLYEKLLSDNPSSQMIRHHLGSAYNTLALTQWGLGQAADGEETHRRAIAMQERLMADVPASLTFQVDLGGSYCNLGNLMYMTGRAKQALVPYEKSIALLESAAGDSASPATARRYLINALVGRARSLTELNRLDEAMRDWDRILKMTPEAGLGSYRIERARTLVAQGNLTKAFAEVNALAPDASKHRFAGFQLAAVCALAAASAKEPQSEMYAARAVELLQQARTAGAFTDAALVQKLRTSTDFQALRTRQDFQALLEQLPK